MDWKGWERLGLEWPVMAVKERTGSAWRGRDRYVMARQGSRGAERLGIGVCWLAYGREAVAPDASRIRD